MVHCKPCVETYGDYASSKLTTLHFVMDTAFLMRIGEDPDE